MQKEECVEAEGTPETCRKVKNFIGRNGCVRASKRAPEHYLPRVGDIILYNENISQMKFKKGYLKKVDRGIGKVLGYCGKNECLLLLHVYRKPGCSCKSSFMASDFRTGLYIYRKLSDYVYTADRYTYQDLDIANPHRDIADLFADDGETTVVPEEQQAYARLVK